MHLLSFCLALICMWLPGQSHLRGIAVTRGVCVCVCEGTGQVNFRVILCVYVHVRLCVSVMCLSMWDPRAHACMCKTTVYVRAHMCGSIKAHT